jgi:predicted amidohydrolase
MKKNVLALFILGCTTMLTVATHNASAQTSIPPFKAAAVAYDPQWGDLEGNIARIAEAANTVADSGARLLVFPEQATVGYIFDNFEMVRPYLDTIPGKTTVALEKVTSARNIYISVGIAELDSSFAGRNGIKGDQLPPSENA